MKNLIFILIILFFTSCTSKNNYAKYQSVFFIIDKNIIINKKDIVNIIYSKSTYDLSKNLYNIQLIFNNLGYKKLYNLFKNSEGKSFGLVVNKQIIQFDIHIIDNFFKEQKVKNKKLTFQFDKYNTRLFLKSFDIEFKE